MILIIIFRLVFYDEFMKSYWCFGRKYLIRACTFDPSLNKVLFGLDLTTDSPRPRQNWPLLGHDSEFGFDWAGKNRGWMPHVLLLFYYLSLWLYLWLIVCTLQRSQNKYTKIRKSQSCRICQKIKIEIWAKNENCESDGGYSE